MTQPKIQSRQLSDSGAIPGSYTSANITIDVAGRVTSAANGGDGAGTVTSIDVSGGTTGLTTTGGPITTSGTITLTGTLAVANGGTGQTTAPNAINALVPDQTGNSGKFLSTDGSIVSWATVSSGTTYTAGNLINTTAFASDIISVRDIIITEPGGDPPPESVYIGVDSGVNVSINARRNTAVGTSSAENLGQGDDNTLIGYRAGRQVLDNGSRNTAVGSDSLSGIADYVDNTALGYQTGFNLTNGNYNIFLGSKSGEGIVTGSSNILLGYRAGENQHIVGSLSDAFIVTTTARSGEGRPYLLGSMTVDANAYLQLDAGFIVHSPTSGDIWFEITTTGELKVAGNEGTAGQVLTSAGPGLPPTWSGAGSGSVGINTEIQLSDGAGGFVAGEAFLTPDPDLGAGGTILTLGVFTTGNEAITSRVTACRLGDVGTDQYGGDLYIEASSALQVGDSDRKGGDLHLLSGNGGTTGSGTRTGAAGTITISVGNSVENPGSNISITGGTSESPISLFNGGNVDIQSGSAVNGGTGGNINIVAADGLNDGIVNIRGGTGTITSAGNGAVKIFAGKTGSSGAHFSVATNDLERLRIGSQGAWNLNQTGGGQNGQVITSNGIATPVSWREVATSPAPVLATDPGRPGEVRYDSSFIYVCVATDTWMRAPIATWP